MDAYERYGRALLRKAERMVGNREDARDILQGLFADLCKKSGPPGGALEVPMDLPYLYRAITNRCLSFLRDETNRGRLLQRHDDALVPAPRTACDERAIGHDLLVKLVARLEPGEGEVLAYRYVDDMTQEEIAELLGLSRKTIGKRLDRIREAVRQMAGESSGGPRVGEKP
ncbi:MAG TPA: sigma-70 family RNA polymerase sigma factor [Polyangiaceae bacterium]|jgi:RNA polymerase sigma-70 factor (ECF subfamily)|nr:sigma-70 family RNA polymerase sigma factor [Polyangiaceae bacterium]